MQLSKFTLPNLWHWFFNLAIPANYTLSIKQLQLNYTPFIKNLDTDFIEFTWVSIEYSKEVKSIINQAKQLGKYDLITPLIDNLILQIANQTNCLDPQQEEVNLPEIWPDLITYIPPDPIRYRIRGFHLPVIIAKKLSKVLRVAQRHLVQKIYSTQSQSELNREQRQSNIYNKFLPIINNYQMLADISNPIIWLIDDIATTGSTLIEVAKTIKKQLPDCVIYGIVLSGKADD